MYMEKHSEEAIDREAQTELRRKYNSRQEAI
jgi:hypothetical protein